MIDALIVLAFLVYCVINGFTNRKKASRGLEEYFLAGRTLPGWLAGFSMAATQYAADTPLLVTGLIATTGIFSLWRLWIYAISFLLIGFVLGICWRRAKVLTDAEFTELRYGGKGASILRALKAFYMGIVVNCTVLAMVLIAAVRICEPFLPWHAWLPQGMIDSFAKILETVNFSLTTFPADHPQHWIRSADNFISILIIVFITTLYSTTGGLRSTVGNDVVQFPIMMIATFVYAWIVIDHVGGFKALNERFRALYGAENQQAVFSFFPVDWNEWTIIFLAVIAVQWFAQVNADGTGYIAQRIMGCATDRDAKMAAIIFTVSQIFLRSLIWLPIGIGLLILYPAPGLSVGGEVSDAFRLEREMTFIYGIRDFLPSGIRGLMLTGLLAALASTVDTHLNWGGSYVTNDLYKGWLVEKIFKRKPKDKELVWVARLSNLIILVIAAVIMVNLGSIQAAWHLTLLFGSGLGVVLILRWLWYRINLWSEITAVVVSLSMSLILLFVFPNLKEELRLLIMVGVSTFAVLGITLLTPPESLEQLISFYRRVQPPGFWQSVAKETGDTSNTSLLRFKRYLSAIFLAVISIFLLLTGVGRFLLEDLGTGNWFSVSLILIGLSFILIPFWWRLVFDRE